MKKTLLCLALAIGATLSSQGQFVKTYVMGSDTNSYLNNGVKISAAILGSTPSGLAKDTKNKLIYLAASGGFAGGSYILTLDSINNKQVYIRAGNSATRGFVDAGATQSKFDDLGNIVIDKKNNLYIADKGNHAIRKLTAFVNITQSQIVSTIAGGGNGLANNTTGSSGYLEETGVKALFKDPQWIEIDNAAGELIIVDRGNKLIRTLNISTGKSSLLAGKKDSKVSADGDYSTASFSDPAVCYLDTVSNNVWVFENNGKIRKIDRKTKKVSTEGTLDQTKLFLADIGGVLKEGNTFFLTYGCKVVSWDATKPTVTTLVAGGVLNSDKSYDSCGAVTNGLSKSAVFDNLGQMLFIGSPKGSKRILVCDQGNFAVRSIYTDGAFSPINYEYKSSKGNKSNDFTIFPNPANQSLNVKFDNLLHHPSIEIFTMDGRNVFQSKEVTNMVESVEISSFNSGMYIIRVSSNEEVKSKRFVKE